MNDTVSHCPHFPRCGGCRYQDLTPTDYIDLKTHRLFEALKGLDRPLSSINFHPLEGLPTHSRRRVVLKALGYGPTQTVNLGFFQAQSHDLVPIHTCLIVTPLIQALLEPLRSFLKKTVGLRGKADICVTHADSGLDIALERVFPVPLTLEQREQAVTFARDQQLARLIIDQEPLYIRHAPTVSFGGYPVAITPHCFLQASPFSDQWLADKVCAGLPSLKIGSKTLKIVDLFCGRGTFALPLTHHGVVTGYEQDDDAVGALRKTAVQHQLPLTIHQRNLFRDPLTQADLKSVDAVVINPPRDGAWSQAKTLAQSKISRIIMVSCNPKTFARDAHILEQGAYQLTDVFPFDQFLWSNHLEMVGYFQLKI